MAIARLADIFASRLLLDAFDSLINEAKGQGATVSMGGVEL